MKLVHVTDASGLMGLTAASILKHSFRLLTGEWASGAALNDGEDFEPKESPYAATCYKPDDTESKVVSIKDWCDSWCNSGSNDFCVIGYEDRECSGPGRPYNYDASAPEREHSRYDTWNLDEPAGSALIFKGKCGAGYEGRAETAPAAS